ncbi:MAG: HD domain-containing protein, partial [Spirochaetota bacterium]
MKLINQISENLLVKRQHPRKEDLRGYYFRDITAIIHSYPFRRLKHKTQVFFSPKNDHICTRIEHVMHVATISVTICKALNLNTELAWAISLGHDLGHSPFGHVGENILSEIVKKKGGIFEHELYSLRVVDFLINYGKGLNLTYAVRDGIANHCGEVFEQAIKPDFSVKDLQNIKKNAHYPATWEGAIVRMADKVAYLGRDLDDAEQLRLITKDSVPASAVQTLGRNNSQIIDTLVTDITTVAAGTGAIGFSDDIYHAVLALKEFNYNYIYGSPILSDYHENFGRILKTLYGYLNDMFEKYSFNVEAYKKEKNVLSVRFGDYLSKMRDFYDRIDQSYNNVV